MMNGAMTILAAWWEPGTQNALDVGDMAAILAFIVAVLSAMGVVSRWWMKALRSIIKDEIEQATKPIQPGANGGLSLPDVARRVTAVEVSLSEIKESQVEVKDALLELLMVNRKNQ